MKAFFETKNGLPINTDIMCAIEGFEYLGYEICTFDKDDLDAPQYKFRAKTMPFIGSTDAMKVIFESIGRLPDPIDFPEILIDKNLLGREISLRNLEEVLGDFVKLNEPIFIMPLQTKLFDGVVLKDESQLSYFKEFKDKTVITSPPLNIISEFRGYVHKNKLVDCRNYSGDFKLKPDFDLIDRIIAAYFNAPIAYTIDLGILDDSKTVVIELSDFWSIGAYGLEPFLYAEMIQDRYFEIVI